MPKDALEKVVECFIDEGFPFGLSPKKIYERAKVVEDEDRPNQIVFVMERHRGIFGERYTPAVPMRNFVAETCKYAFDPEDETLEEISRSVKGAQISVGGIIEKLMEDSLDFEIEPIDKGFHVEELVASESHVVESKDEFINWARKIPENWSLDFIWEEALEYGVGNEELKKLKKNVLEGCKDKAEETAKWA